MKNYLFTFFVFIGALVVHNEGYAQTDNYPGTTLDFDGTDDYVVVPHDSIGNPASDFTIEAWVKLNAYPSDNADIVSKHKYEGGTARSGYVLEYNYTNGIKAIMGTPDGWKHVDGSTWNINEWHHIAMVYNASTHLLELFDNGVLQGTDTVNNPAYNTQNLYFGSSEYYPSNLLSGKIDEVRYWTAALDSTQIRENMNLPLSGSETGLVSYWQFNDGSGTTLTDTVSENYGTLTNMTDDDWVNSTIPFGQGYSDTETEANGTVTFTNTGLSMNFNSQNGAEITVTRIDTLPNVKPDDPDKVYDDQYWVINRFGSGNFNADLTFTLSEDLTESDENNPLNIELYTRSSTADTNWAYLTYATSVNATNNEATFSGITSFGQFIIVKTTTVITLYQKHFDLMTNNFNSIDVGDNSSPAFTDIDGDGLLDLLIGEYVGNLNHYEQNAANSTSFTLVTTYFNSIDVGTHSTPAFTDLDDDGLLDMLVGETEGNLNHYEQDTNNSTSFHLVTENFNSIDVGYYSAPTFTDIDGDGLLDLIVGEYDHNLNHYEQDTNNSTSFHLVTEYFNSIDAGTISTPAFTDLDDDGLLDLIVGNTDGKLSHYEQDAKNSNSFALVTNNFNSIDVGGYSTPAFDDMDDDGLLDLLIGENDGNVNYYEQQGVSQINFGKLLTGNTNTKVYSIKASTLKDNLDINCPSGYKVSQSENSGYVQSLSISPVNRRVSDSIYVRFEPVSETTYSGNIEHSTTNAETKNIAVSGTGIDSADDFPGNALDFDGSNDYVDCGDNSSLNFTDTLTIEVWIKADSWKSNVWEGSIISKEGSKSGYMLRCGDDGKVNFNLGINGGWHEITTDAADALSLNTWYHIAAVYDGATQKIYINGELVKEASVTGSIDANTKHLLIGTSPSYYNRCFSGQTDEVRLWNVVLDSTQIRENMYRTLTGRETGLVSYWQCNDGSGTILSDIVGGNTGTLTNMTDDDWVNSTAPLPFITGGNGSWEQNATWDAGQNAPVHAWSRVKIKHQVTLNSNMELFELNMDTTGEITISDGDTLIVTGR